MPMAHCAAGGGDQSAKGPALSETNIDVKPDKFSSFRQRDILASRSSKTWTVSTRSRMVARSPELLMYLNRMARENVEGEVLD
jgi:hypothetical protein